jgi:hypothetical protein
VTVEAGQLHPRPERRGACDDQQAARRAAEAWMRNNHGTGARAAPVDLDAMESMYVPAGAAIEAAAHDGDQITWQPAEP